MSKVAWLLLLLLGACSAAPPELPAPLRSVPVREFQQMVEAPSFRALGAALDLVPPTSGLIRVVHGKTACRPTHGVNPLPVLPKEAPRVGRLLAVTWSTRTGGNPPAESCWLLTSFRPLNRPIDFSPYGMPGCWLLVNPDQIIAVPTTPGGLIVRDGGHVLLRWMPAASAAGIHFWLQLLVAAPGETPSGWLVAPAVEVLVGSA